jgi:hypothetical protein
MERVIEDNRFTQLLKALQTGWEIDEPVLLGKLWRTAVDGQSAYHFVLKKKAEEKTTLLSVKPSSQLLMFLAENNIQINAI